MTQLKVTTADVIKDMMVEPIARSILDSGSAYGYHFQENKQVTDWDSVARVNVSYDVELVEVYHYLNEVLQRDRFCEKVDAVIARSGSEWVQEGIETLLECNLIGKTSRPINTYNYESNLSQVLLFQVFTVPNADEFEDDDVYCLLQLHNGCDVRGGYTDPRCFKLVGLLTGLVDVYGDVDGQPVSNLYCGYKLTYDDDEGDHEDVALDQAEEVCLDFIPALEGDVHLLSCYNLA